MSPFAKRITIVLAICLGVLALTSTEARAQRRFNPYRNAGAFYPSGYWGYSDDPYGLHGMAAVISASGNYMKDREKARSAAIDNRRKLQEQWQWERENTPTPEQERQRLQKQLVDHARNNPTITEIWSGVILNDILRDIQLRPSYYATDTPLDPNLVAKINLTTGKQGANFGILKSGTLTWPLLFRRKMFDEDRQRLDQLVAQTIKPAETKQMDPQGIEEMMQRLEDLSRKLVRVIRSAPEEETWTPSLYIDARHFLDQFKDAVKVLRQPDAVKYVTGQYAAQGKTVAELVKFMTENGLFFAPVTPGEETAYTALHRALAAQSR
jgi:hypothetical protein